MTQINLKKIQNKLNHRNVGSQEISMIKWTKLQMLLFSILSITWFLMMTNVTISAITASPSHSNNQSISVRNKTKESSSKVDKTAESLSISASKSLEKSQEEASKASESVSESASISASRVSESASISVSKANESASAAAVKASQSLSQSLATSASEAATSAAAASQAQDSTTTAQNYSTSTNGWGLAQSGMCFVSDSNKYYVTVKNPVNYVYESIADATAAGAVAGRSNQYARN